MQNRKRVTIIQGAHHFLYLPVHYALRANCFGYVPDKYELCLEPAPSGTDRETYRILMGKAIPGHDYIGFAVGDPAELLHDQDTRLSPAVVLAGIITNSAFWAVDRRTYDCRFLKDLSAFDKIIAFREGTTSHGIARRIYRDGAKTEAIEQVLPGNELTSLTSSPAGTMALTPDILGIDKLMADKPDKYRVELALGQTPEYNNVLVTALLSRVDVVNEHLELVSGLLKAIQRALLMVRRGDPEIIKFAMDTHGENEARIKGALRRAEVVQVFPPSIEVSPAQWENAARAAADAAGRQYDKTEHERVQSVYLRAVMPYQQIVKQAGRVEVVPRAEMAQDGGHVRGDRFRWLARVAPLAVGVVITLRLPMNDWMLSIQIAWLLVGLGILVWWARTKPDNSTLAAPVWGWLGIELTILLTAAGLAS